MDEKAIQATAISNCGGFSVTLLAIAPEDVPDWKLLQALQDKATEIVLQHVYQCELCRQMAQAHNN